MQKYGWLIFNGNVQNEKLLNLNEYYKEIAKECSIDLELVKNSDIFAIMCNGETIIKTLNNLKEPEFILFLDKDINLAKSLERCGYRVFNSSSVLDICDDKILTYQYISEKSNIKFPKTLIPPFIFNNCKELEESRDKFVDFVESELKYPLIIKEAKGSFGEQVYLINNRQELINKKEELGSTPHLYQEFIKSSFGKDVRIHIVGNKFVAGMLRYSDESFKSNINTGGKFKKINIREDFIDMAIEVSKILQSDFIGVDILFGENEEPIFCEVNSNSYIKNITELTGVNVGKEIFEHILKEI